MDYMENYRKWLASDMLTESEKNELLAVENDTKEVEDRFYRDLEFGTAGMRGVLGTGTNRINIYNVRQASYGVGVYVNNEGKEAAERGVLIGYTDGGDIAIEIGEEQISFKPDEVAKIATYYDFGKI